MIVRELSSWVETDNQTNALATATRAAPTGGIAHFIAGVSGGFSATASGVTLILKEGSTELGRWYVYDSLTVTFPSPIKLAPGTVANLELAAGGGGIVGAATMTGYTQ